MRRMRKRSGHLQSKGRFLAAQILALLKGDLWLHNARGQCGGFEIGGAAPRGCCIRCRPTRCSMRLTAEENAACAPRASVL
jgi:threonine aldolase